MCSNDWKVILSKTKLNLASTIKKKQDFKKARRMKNTLLIFQRMGRVFASITTRGGVRDQGELCNPTRSERRSSANTKKRLHPLCACTYQCRSSRRASSSRLCRCTVDMGGARNWLNTPTNLTLNTTDNNYNTFRSLSKLFSNFRHRISGIDVQIVAPLHVNKCT